MIKYLGIILNMCWCIVVILFNGKNGLKDARFEDGAMGVEVV